MKHKITGDNLLALFKACATVKKLPISEDAFIITENGPLYLKDMTKEEIEKHFNIDGDDSYLDEEILKPECEHKNSMIWEPHLAGARKCKDCGWVKNPNRHHAGGPLWAPEE